MTLSHRRNGTLQRLFVSAGAMKAATTWMYANLIHHRSVFFTPEKEIHFLAQTTTGRQYLTPAFREKRASSKLGNAVHLAPARQERMRSWYEESYQLDPVDLDWYKNLFRDARPGQWCADFSNLSALIPAEGWTTLCRDVCPTIRALYVLRNPVDRLWSHFKFHHSVCGSSDDSCKLDRHIAAFFANEAMLRHGRYTTTIDAIRRGLGAEHLLIAHFDDLVSNPLAFLRRIETFLGLKPCDYLDFPSFTKRVNPTETSEPPVEFLRRAIPFATEELRLLRRIGLEYPPCWDTGG
jgi:hypothetical protein